VRGNRRRIIRNGGEERRRIEAVTGPLFHSPKLKLGTGPMAWSDVFSSTNSLKFEMEVRV